MYFPANLPASLHTPPQEFQNIVRKREAQDASHNGADSSGGARSIRFETEESRRFDLDLLG